MILGFYPQFETPIREGIKIHSLRADPTNRWKPGNEIHFAVGVRTKNFRQFNAGKCVSTQKVIIDWSEPYQGLGTWLPRLFIDSVKRDSKTLELLARNDGFESLAEFLTWFNKGIEGKIIHWTDFRY